MTDQLLSLKVERHGHIAEVILEGPGKGNAMGPDFWRECPRVFAELDRDEDVRAVILRGAGGHFSYGLDLRAMMPELAVHLAPDALARSRTLLMQTVAEMQVAFERIEACRKPVIAAVTGWCIGGGIDMISACDVRLASADARFSVREVRLAMVADLGTLHRLPRIIGQGHARELAMTGRDIDAARALRIGLVNDVYPDEASLLEAARKVAQEIADNPPLVVQGVKEVMNFSADHSSADAARFVAVWNAAFLSSSDLTEAIGAFVEKRPPRFTGR